jgi:uncharacterized metal-binding protein YceD (DUF177 family)
MNNTKDYLIPFSGLKLGKHTFEFSINNTFLKYYNYEEFNHSSINVKVILDKKTTMLELSFSHKGIANVPCDLSNEDFDLPIKGKLKLIVKFGETFNDDNDEMIVLPHGEYQIDVAQYIYEMIVLSVPAKRIHPGVKDGTLQTDVLKNLEKFSPKEKENKKEEIDPRWENLKKLLTDKK